MLLQTEKRNPPRGAIIGIIILALALICLLISWLMYQGERDKLEAAMKAVEKEKAEKAKVKAVKEKAADKPEGKGGDQ